MRKYDLKINNSTFNIKVKSFSSEELYDLSGDCGE